MKNVLNLAQLEAVFAEWDRRVAAGNWDGPPDPKASAEIFAEIAAELYPNG